jgi:hypothetical protein
MKRQLALDTSPDIENANRIAQNGRMLVHFCLRLSKGLPWRLTWHGLDSCFGTNRGGCDRAE